MATLTITTDAGQAARVAEAFGFGVLGLGRNATNAEVKAFYVADMKNKVHSYETKRNADAAANAVVPMPDPT